MDLYKLEIFVLVAQEGSLSKAATRMYMSQPAISQHIHELEMSLGTQLFRRGPRGVELTAAGKTLHTYAQDILKLVAEAKAAVTEVERLSQGRLLIGATPGIGEYFLPEWMQSFKQRFPQVTIALQTEVTSQLLISLLTNQIHVGFIEGEIEPEEMETLALCPLHEITHRVIVGPRHPWWNRTSISFRELNGQAFVMRHPECQARTWLEEHFRAFGIRPHIDAEFDNLESIKQVVKSGTSLTILPDYVVEQERMLEQLHEITVQERPMRRMLQLVWNKRDPLPPIAQQFLLHMQSYFPRLADLMAA
ncbi:DNA-binding transcriptional LysR family regulator [Thermosporothrix hazakensis]|jgi:DNA-binding transcriptional LysR family regulator|uniref:DNA-binding transcriptional LysR family regulator n=1 Tax=Thermosporothrix hazakensis TaxID=644383 RepID=A0A326U6Y2_THEHA|nr:LysR family transcriptional regulator [Thermosporothrix hazakensis]PZW29292.1 DNA-binding transcriptional LysR family regulator [Thermosporothrix hazakensis]GCE45355.1 LysR family transcriptional regulator [Thermosporothrix hazakensis]